MALHRSARCRRQRLGKRWIAATVIIAMWTCFVVAVSEASPVDVCALARAINQSSSGPFVVDVYLNESTRGSPSAAGGVEVVAAFAKDCVINANVRLFLPELNRSRFPVATSGRPVGTNATTTAWVVSFSGVTVQGDITMLGVDGVRTAGGFTFLFQSCSVIATTVTAMDIAVNLAHASFVFVDSNFTSVGRAVAFFATRVSSSSSGDEVDPGGWFAFLNVTSLRCRIVIDQAASPDGFMSAFTFGYVGAEPTAAEPRSVLLGRSSVILEDTSFAITTRQAFPNWAMVMTPIGLISGVTWVTRRCAVELFVSRGAIMSFRAVEDSLLLVTDLYIGITDWDRFNAIEFLGPVIGSTMIARTVTIRTNNIGTFVRDVRGLFWWHAGVAHSRILVDGVNMVVRKGSVAFFHLIQNDGAPSTNVSATLSNCDLSHIESYRAFGQWVYIMGLDSRSGMVSTLLVYGNIFRMTEYDDRLVWFSDLDGMNVNITGNRVDYTSEITRIVVAEGRMANVAIVFRDTAVWPTSQNVAECYVFDVWHAAVVNVTMDYSGRVKVHAQYVRVLLSFASVSTLRLTVHADETEWGVYGPRHLDVFLWFESIERSVITVTSVHIQYGFFIGWLQFRGDVRTSAIDFRDSIASSPAMRACEFLGLFTASTLRVSNIQFTSTHSNDPPPFPSGLVMFARPGCNVSDSAILVHQVAVQCDGRCDFLTQDGSLKNSLVALDSVSLTNDQAPPGWKNTTVVDSDHSKVLVRCVSDNVVLRLNDSFPGTEIFPCLPSGADCATIDCALGPLLTNRHCHCGPPTPTPSPSVSDSYSTSIRSATVAPRPSRTSSSDIATAVKLLRARTASITGTPVLFSAPQRTSLPRVRSRTSPLQAHGRRNVTASRSLSRWVVRSGVAQRHRTASADADPMPAAEASTSLDIFVLTAELPAALQMAVVGVAALTVLNGDADLPWVTTAAVYECSVRREPTGLMVAGAVSLKTLGLTGDAVGNGTVSSVLGVTRGLIVRCLLCNAAAVLLGVGGIMLFGTVTRRARVLKKLNRVAPAESAPSGTTKEAVPGGTLSEWSCSIVCAAAWMPGSTLRALGPAQDMLLCGSTALLLGFPFDESPSAGPQEAAISSALLIALVAMLMFFGARVTSAAMEFSVVVVSSANGADGNVVPPSSAVVSSWSSATGEWVCDRLKENALDFEIFKLMYGRLFQRARGRCLPMGADRLSVIAELAFAMLCSCVRGALQPKSRCSALAVWNVFAALAFIAFAFCRPRRIPAMNVLNALSRTVALAVVCASASTDLLGWRSTATVRTTLIFALTAVRTGESIVGHVLSRRQRRARKLRLSRDADASLHLPLLSMTNPLSTPTK